MKQEVLEEVAKECLRNNILPTDGDFAEGYITGSMFGAKWQQEQDKNKFSEEEVLQIIKNAFNQGERYGWDTRDSIGNINEMRSKIPFISLEKYLETFKNK